MTTADLSPPDLTAPALVDGRWAYPAAWTTEDREAWEAVQGRKIHETKRRSDVEAKVAAAAASPAAMLAAARLEADDAQRAREWAERRAEGEAAWQKAIATLGPRAARVELDAEGDVVVMRAMGELESDNADRRAERLAAQATKGAGTPEEKETRAMLERTGAYLDATLATVIHPTRERMKEIFARYPLFRPLVYGERDRLIMGLRSDRGKGPAL